MLREVGLTSYQSDNASYKILNLLSTLEPKKDERKWSSISAQLDITYKGLPEILDDAFCIGREREGRDLFLYREFEASLGACGGCPVIGDHGVGCPIYDARAHPDKLTATREARVERKSKCQ